MIWLINLKEIICIFLKIELNREAFYLWSSGCMDFYENQEGQVRKKFQTCKFWGICARCPTVLNESTYQLESKHHSAKKLNILGLHSATVSDHSLFCH